MPKISLGMMRIPSSSDRSTAPESMNIDDVQIKALMKID